VRLCVYLILYKESLRRLTMRNYGIRICLTCGKHFTATYASQLTCCEECNHKRKLDLQYAREREAILVFERRIQALKNAVKRIAKRPPAVAVSNVQNVSQQATEPQKRTYPKTCVVCGRQFQSPYPNSKTCPNCIKVHSTPTSVTHLYKDGGDD